MIIFFLPPVFRVHEAINSMASQWPNILLNVDPFFFFFLTNVSQQANVHTHTPRRVTYNAQQADTKYKGTTTFSLFFF